MCKVVTYVVTDIMIEISLSLACYNNNEFYCHCYLDKEYKTLYPLTTSSHLPAIFLSGSIVTPTPTVTQGKGVLWIELISCSYYVSYSLMFGT